MIRNSLLPALAVTMLCLSASANTTVAKIFGDNMVLQRGRAFPVWGWATPGEKINILFHEQSRKIVADKSGYWIAWLATEGAGGPYSLTIKGKNVISISNVLVGDVWICSGQSNMEMPIEGWGKIDHYKEEINAADYPEIRQFKVPNAVSAIPVKDVSGGDWKICNSANAGEFTAAGYFFARALYQKLHVPIGLINSTWGGTMVETWISRGAFEKSDEFKSMINGIPADEMTGRAKKSEMETQATIQKLQTQTGIYSDKWRSADYNDHAWPSMNIPGVWEEQQIGLSVFDGVIWFRKMITVSSADAGKPATLNLAKVDDNDETFVNGAKVGSTKKYGERRIYQVPAGVLHAGENIIAVRVEDTGGNGGIYGDSADMSIVINGMPQALAGKWHFAIEGSGSATASVGPNSYPTLLFNAMIYPLLPFAVKGAIWYQGEANTGRAFQYRKSFPLMITDWRDHWKQGDFPFLFVQLSSFGADNGNSTTGSTWAELREAQQLTLSVPNTGMAVTTDIGDSADIHPKDKQDVGKRLAAIALSGVYDQKVESSGPVFKDAVTEGNKMIVNFKAAGDSLVAHDKYGYLRGFELAGEDHKFHFAKALINNGRVEVYQEGIEHPVAVRYGWADYPADANLFNVNGFPASPFRSDNWIGITDNKKFVVEK